MDAERRYELSRATGATRLAELAYIAFQTALGRSDFAPFAETDSSQRTAWIAAVNAARVPLMEKFTQELLDLQGRQTININLPTKVSPTADDGRRIAEALKPRDGTNGQ